MLLSLDDETDSEMLQNDTISSVSHFRVEYYTYLLMQPARVSQFRVEIEIYSYQGYITNKKPAQLNIGHKVGWIFNKSARIKMREAHIIVTTRFQSWLNAHNWSWVQKEGLN